MSTANTRMAYKNAVDHPSCVLSCSVGGILLPLDNTKTRARERIFRVTEPGTSFRIKATYGGSGVYVSMASLIRHNLSGAATFQFRGYSTVDWTGAIAVDSGVLSAIEASTLGELTWGVDPLGIDASDPMMGLKIATAWMTRTLCLSWHIEISDIGNSDGVIDISRLWVAEYQKLTHNPVVGLLWGWQEKSETWRTDAGSARTDAQLPYRGGQFDLKQMAEADRQVWMAAARYCGLGRRDFFLSIRPEDTEVVRKRDMEMSAIFQGQLPRPAWVDGDRFEVQITVEEA